ncbi:MAG: hypothetical protein IKT57_01035 [Clostridia bacterium]|nr:hypothetical protein [Clostridia bacterium]
MASSSYYLRMYKKYKELEKDYKDQAEELKDIYKAINSGTLENDADDVTKQVNKLHENMLAAGLNLGNVYYLNQDQVLNYKEKAGLEDIRLDAAYDAVVREYNAVVKKQQDAKKKKNDYYDDYKDALAREREEANNSD